MNNAAPNPKSGDPIIPEAELRIAEARLAAFDKDALGHTLDTLRTWSATRASNPAAPCPTPTKLR